MRSRAANQTKREPFPASATEAEAETPGAEHPQTPSGTTDERALPGGDAAPGTSEELPPVQGVHTPQVRSTGRG